MGVPYLPATGRAFFFSINPCALRYNTTIMKYVFALMISALLLHSCASDPKSSSDSNTNWLTVALQEDIPQVTAVHSGTSVGIEVLKSELSYNTSAMALLESGANVQAKKLKVELNNGDGGAMLALLTNEELHLYANYAMVKAVYNVDENKEILPEWPIPGGASPMKYYVCCFEGNGKTCNSWGVSRDRACRKCNRRCKGKGKKKKNSLFFDLLGNLDEGIDHDI